MANEVTRVETRDIRGGGENSAKHEKGNEDKASLVYMYQQCSDRGKPNLERGTRRQRAECPVGVRPV